MKYTYKHTTYACYIGYITQAIINNLAPLLFIIFQSSYDLSFEEVGRLVLINFGMQILTDLVAVKYVDKIGYRKAAVLAHFLAASGLVFLGVLPNIMPSPYLGFIIAVMVYAVGGGLLEVLVSPIVESLPGEEKDRAMSLLHSFYCWGQVGVVLITTLLIKVMGQNLWPILPILWASVPLWNLFNFLKVPLMPPVHEKALLSVKQLFQTKFFLIALVLMLCAGAAELTMSQWSSLFAQTGLKVSKVMGDLLGPCLFAVLMGIGRAAYGIWGNKINLRNAMGLSSVLCIICYIITIFAPHPVLSLLGCAFSGLSVSLMWPGTFSLTSARFPMGGTAMFGLMAVAGDLGGSVGPWMAGFIADISASGLKAGLMVGLIFPAIMLLGVTLFGTGKGGNKELM